MASAVERFHIVLSRDERSAWNSGAARLGVATGEYVRRAVASFEAGLSPTELDQLSTLAGEVEQSAARISGMIDRAVAIIDRPFDDDEMRRTAAARLADDPVLLDAAKLDFHEPVFAA
jgi:hypothetical protein